MELEDFVRQCEEAWQAFVTGDPGPAMVLFSRRDDVTLANPWGPAVTDGLTSHGRWKRRLLASAVAM